MGDEWSCSAVERYSHFVMPSMLKQTYRRGQFTVVRWSRLERQYGLDAARVPSHVGVALRSGLDEEVVRPARTSVPTKMATLATKNSDPIDELGSANRR